MKRKEGFTLIELLVVMAIIAILAAIVVPNIVGWIGRARMTRAQAEIESIETALAKMLTDASRNGLNDLIDPEKLTRVLTGSEEVNPVRPPLSAELFARIQKIYTNTFYALLRNGREVLKNDPATGVPYADSDPALTGFQYQSILRHDVIKKLGTSYLEIGFDPWGNLYQIYPAPWSRGNLITDPDDSSRKIYANPIIFRTYLKPEGNTRLPGAGDTTVNDGYAVNWLPEEGLFGFPAPRNPGIAFIYSAGANLVSGQLVYTNRFGLNEASLFYEEQDDEFKGGGDDVNNWDSESSWTRFYS